MLKLTAFIPYEIITIYTECGARTYGNCKVVRAARVQRGGGRGEIRGGGKGEIRGGVRGEIRVGGRGR